MLSSAFLAQFSGTGTTVQYSKLTSLLYCHQDCHALFVPKFHTLTPTSFSLDIQYRWIPISTCRRPLLYRDSRDTVYLDFKKEPKKN